MNADDRFSGASLGQAATASSSGAMLPIAFVPLADLLQDSRSPRRHLNAKRRELRLSCRPRPQYVAIAKPE